MTREEAAAARRVRLGFVYGVALLLFLLGALLTWRRSGELLIDFGRELYIAWRLSEGQVLYRDIASLMGPLAPYLNASLFRLFGVSVTTLLVSNLVIAGLVMLAIGRFWAFAKPRTLFMLLVVFMVLSGFSHLNRWAIFNFGTPYSHDATIGTLLAISALVAAHIAACGNGRRWWLLAGLAVGCTFLTKPELFVAATAGTGAMIVGQARAHGAAALRRDVVRPVVWFLPGLIAPMLLAVVLFLGSVPPRDAVASMLGAWTSVLSAGSPQLFFYRHVTGLDAPLMNLARMVVAAALLFVPVAVGRSLSRRVRDFATLPLVRRVGATVVIASLVAAAMVVLPVAYAFRGLPVLTSLIALAAWQRIRAERSRAQAEQWVAVFGWAMFALAMMAKTLLKVNVDFYGFYLALPAALLLTWYALEAIPRALDERAAPTYLRVVSVAGATFLLLILVTSANRTSQRTGSVGAAGDRLHYEPALSGSLSDVVDLLEARIGPSESLLVLPEGAGLNFLTRRLNPIGHVSFLPPEFATFGPQMLAALRAKPPAYVLLWSRPMDAYGFDAFRTAAYAHEIISFLDRRYIAVASVKSPNTGSGLRGPSFTLYRYGGGEVQVRKIRRARQNPGKRSPVESGDQARVTMTN